MGISRKCVRTWIARYAAEGDAGLVDRSSRPHTSPTRTPAEVEDRIMELRDRERRGPDWLGAELGVPARTVSRVLAGTPSRSEEHTSELQSPVHIVCRLLLEKKKKEKRKTINMKKRSQTTSTVLQ